ncbi:MaoC family dehydratase [Algiphilus sp. NNCM1]|jgi:acyl dehydratase|uniref:MaoC family dehydratase n=1 Tax=Algiphilus sp. TaxID=1872431 RepID=UPI001CA76531|nr:MaoC family dehydratase [Algiphilus sp.]MBY8964470.1 MaoC family dehydratase [Algiphilus acroporae]MCI5063704.1 MaoC family dehydratase [Algiphilus sp.]MCI5103154.1 MaoC family dehydratase [Algiphilus sp.]
MKTPHRDEVGIGQELPPLRLPPVTRTTLALFAGASGDHNPIHIDSDFAKSAGMPDVFAHGMLSMAYLGRFLTQWAPQTQLRRFSVRFAAITPVGARLTCTGKVTELTEGDGEALARLEIGVIDDAGEVKLVGEALVALA